MVLGFLVDLMSWLDACVVGFLVEVEAEVLDVVACGL